MAAASPPPMQMAAQPYRLSWRSKAFKSVVRIRAPEAPMGWPSATAPPWTLIFSWEIPSSFMAANTTTAKASLISKRSISSRVIPARPKTFLMAPMGAVVNHSGSWATEVWATILAMGLRPWALAYSAVVTTTAEAPSLILEALAAVTVPSLSKAGRRLGILARSARKGSSSRSTTVTAPLFPGTSTGTISAAKVPSSAAFRALS